MLRLQRHNGSRGVPRATTTRNGASVLHGRGDSLDSACVSGREAGQSGAGQGACCQTSAVPSARAAAIVSMDSCFHTQALQDPRGRQLPEAPHPAPACLASLPSVSAARAHVESPLDVSISAPPSIGEIKTHSSQPHPSKPPPQPTRL